MDKKKQIEEMAIIVEHACDDCNGNIDDCLKCPHKRHHEYYGCGEEKTATELYEAGCRIIPEGAVVLTREEYKELYDSERASYYRAELLVVDNDLLARKLTDVRKETAREIIEMLIPPCDKCDEDWHKGCLCLRATIAELIAQRYGVEVGK